VVNCLTERMQSAVMSKALYVMMMTETSIAISGSAPA
jgi:hypothetical protein